MNGGGAAFCSASSRVAPGNGERNVENVKIASKVILVPIENIKPYENNPRDNEAAVSALVNSITEHGFSSPLEIDSENTIICGHARYKAAIRLGMEVVPCLIRDDLTPEQVITKRIADNKISELAFWDNELLRVELKKSPAFAGKIMDFTNRNYHLCWGIFPWRILAVCLKKII